MVDIAQPIIPIARAHRVFKNHKYCVNAVAVLPNRGWMVTGSNDKTLCLWDLKYGVALKKMERHGDWVNAVAVSGNGKLIASGDDNGELIAWIGDTSGESFDTKSINAHSKAIISLDFSPDSAVLATVSWDKTMKLWRTDTWKVCRGPIDVGDDIYQVRYSPSGHLLVIATHKHIQIWNPSELECIAKLKANHCSLAWTPDGTRLLSGGWKSDSVILEWNTSTWKPVGDPWSGHTSTIWALAVNSTGTLLASASEDKNVRLWRISDRQTVAVFSLSHLVRCVTFSVDGQYILCGGDDNNITEWGIPEDVLLEDRSNTQASSRNLPMDVAEEPGLNDTPDHHYKILSINTIVRSACMIGNLSSAQELLAKQINLDRKNHNAYANRSFVSSRKYDWDNALRDAVQSVDIHSSLPGYISKGIAFCGKMEFSEATKAFDLAFMLTAQDSSLTCLILLVKAIALFNANKQKEAMQRIKELAAICPDADTLACHVVEAYLRIQLGIKALNDAHYNEAAEEFTVAINSGVLSNEGLDYSQYEIFVILFGWDLASSWQAAYQNRCHAFLQAGKLVEAHRAYTSMMYMYDETTKASYFEWSTAFKKECSAVYVASADAALAASEYDRAVELYSAAIDLDATTGTLFANRCKAKLGKMSWEEALIDARKVTELSPHSYLGFHLEHAALHGAQQYDEAMKVLQLNLAQLRDTRDPEMQVWRKECHALYIASGDAALTAGQYDVAIKLYSTALDLGPETDSVFTNRCKAKLGKELWEEALVDAQKVIELKPSSYIGYHLKHAALHGVQQYDEAIKVLQLNLVKLCDVHEQEVQVSKNEWHALYVAGGDAAFTASAYDMAIKLYSVAIDLDPTTDMIFGRRCEAKLGMMLWEQALDDARKVTELKASSYFGYQLKHAALHGMQRYDEAIEAFEIMLLRLDDAHNPDLQVLRRQYMLPSEVQCTIQRFIDAYMENVPPHLLDTFNGRLCGRESQNNEFKTSAQYKELLSFTIRDADLRMQRIKDAVVTFFSYVMLSHRWEGKEARLHEIDDEDLYELDPVGSIKKLQSFCRIVREAGYRWAWIDTCCIDQNNNVEVQRSVNSMFAWYRHSALTIIYLSDVPPSSVSGAMAKSAWITRGWTVQEFLAPKTVLFYHDDWTLYLNDRSPNHKESAVIMRELENATGINIQALTAFRPGMTGVREKLQWASMRVTTLPEDIAYSLFGLFNVHLPVIYGETKQNALGRLLQEIIAQSGDIGCLHWTGRSSEFNSCLPANITSYAAPPFLLPSLSEGETESLVSSLRGAGAVEAAIQLYTTLDQLSIPRFAHRRLHLPCIVFTVTDIARRSTSQEQGSYFDYAIKANGLDDLLITTEDKLIPFSRRMPNRQKLLLVRPWDRDLLELSDRLMEGSGMPPSSPSDFGDSDDMLPDSEYDSQALRLLIHLGQPFQAFLLVRRGPRREFSRIAADHNIVAQVKDMASVRDLMDVRTLEIL